MDVTRKEPEYVLSQLEGLEKHLFKKVSLCSCLAEEGQGFCSFRLSASAYRMHQDQINKYQ
jgi:hypothetical protein